MCSADNDLLHMQLVNAWVSIAIVRQHFQCQLPIELFYDGESEMPTSFKNLFQVPPETSCYQPPAMLLKWRRCSQDIAHYRPSTWVLGWLLMRNLRSMLGYKHQLSMSHRYS